MKTKPLFRSDIEPQVDNPQHEQYIAGLVNSLIAEIENKAAVVSDSEYFLTKLKLVEAAKQLRIRYGLVNLFHISCHTICFKSIDT